MNVTLPSLTFALSVLPLILIVTSPVALFGNVIVKSFVLPNSIELLSIFIAGFALATFTDVLKFAV